MVEGQKSGLDRLSADEVEVVRQCLSAAVSGPFFPEWEFSTLFGIERDKVATVLNRWPDRESPEVQDVAVSNTLNHLLFYPHRQWEVWGEFISVAPKDVASVLAHWAGEDQLDISPTGYLDRMR